MVDAFSMALYQNLFSMPPNQNAELSVKNGQPQSTIKNCHKKICSVYIESDSYDSTAKWRQILHLF